MVETIWCGLDAAIHMIGNHTAIAVQYGCRGYCIGNTAAAIAGADNNLKLWCVCLF
jgi:hypothetical protein